MEVSIKGGTPSHHPFIVGIFHEINLLNQPAIGDPHGSPIDGTPNSCFLGVLATKRNPA